MLVYGVLVEVVKFCYLDDMLHADGGQESELHGKSYMMSTYTC